MSKLTEARQAVGGLTTTSKMPCKSYNLPAQECNIGSKLRKQKGSTCSKCYALKGRYHFPNVKDALYRRFNTIKSKHWVDNMVTAIKSPDYFRWHDSGDLQDEQHLDNIVQVARRTPDTLHWLPTREYKLIRNYSGDVPENLIIRVSAPDIDGPAPAFTHTSTVHKNIIPTGHVCPAPKQGGKCGDCRACWDKSVTNVSYGEH